MVELTKLIYIVEDNRTDKVKNEGIIFVHGAVGCIQVWKNQIKEISTVIKVIVVNLPGHFGSECPETPIMETYIAAIDKILEDLRLNKVILAGQSMGGAIILSYYLQYPQKVDGLILIGTGARLRVMPTIFELIQSNFQYYIDWSRNFAFHKNTFKTNKELIEEVKKNMAQISPQIAYYDYKICDEFDVMDRIGEIKVPTLIIVGDDDKLTPIKYSKYMHDRIEKSKMHIIKDTGHLVMLEKSEEVNRYIKDFLHRI
ncbi:MAG: alpha/beta fold hydrolase [Promethearchaeota archaeon]